MKINSTVFNITDKSLKAVIPDCLRWILVLPVSLFSSILITFPIHWAVMLIQFTYKRGDTIEVDDPVGLLACIPPEMLEYFGYDFFIPMVLIVAGAKIAPKFKFQTGITIAILFAALCGFGYGYIFSGNMQVDISWLRLIITIVLRVAGISCGLYFAQKNSSRKGQFLTLSKTP